MTIVDDGYDPAGLPLSFDFEGVAKQRVALVEARHLPRRRVRRADRGARRRRLDRPRPAGPEPVGPVPAQHAHGGRRRRRATSLIGGLDRGLLVTRFHYTNPVHPKLAIVTGMTRDGTFLVEGGRIVGPVRNLRYTQSYLDALAGTVAVARERKTLKGFLGGVVVPAVRIDGWTFTGAPSTSRRPVAAAAPARREGVETFSPGLGTFSSNTQESPRPSRDRTTTRRPRRPSTEPESPPMSDPSQTPTPTADLHALPDPNDARATAEAIMFEIRRVIVGQDEMLERVLVGLLSGGHILLEGVPGLAKTLTIKTLAEVLGGTSSASSSPRT